MTKFTIQAKGDYSLAASAGFLCGFTPAGGASATLDDGRLAIAFLDEHTFRPAAVAIGPDDGGVSVEGPREVEAQVARILSLDHDARGLEALGARDAVVAGLLSHEPGFRPVCFSSPYEAAVWGILAQRTPMAMAARLRRRLAEHAGCALEAFGTTLVSSPTPKALLALDSFPGLSDEKLLRLKGVADAALEGRLVASRLRAMGHAEAHDELRALRGIGAWTAEHVLVRGCGSRDVLPTSEPRLLRGMAEAYGLDTLPSATKAEALAEAWRPFRTWIAVMLVRSVFRRDATCPSDPELAPLARTRRGGGRRRAAPSPAAAAPSPRARGATPRRASDTAA